MAGPLRLEVTLEPRGPAAAIVLTDDQVEELGDGKRTFPVRVEVDDTTVALRLARMGGENLIGFSKAARAEAGVEIGGSYRVVITRDDGERTVAVPDDLAAKLRSGRAHAKFDALAYSHRKEYVRWVTEAKRPQTRADRIARTVEMVRAGQTR
jgi:hypothetical protein